MSNPKKNPNDDLKTYLRTVYLPLQGKKNAPLRGKEAVNKIGDYDSQALTVMFLGAKKLLMSVDVEKMQEQHSSIIELSLRKSEELKSNRNLRNEEKDDENKAGSNTVSTRPSVMLKNLSTTIIQYIEYAKQKGVVSMSWDTFLLGYHDAFVFLKEDVLRLAPSSQPLLYSKGVPSLFENFEDLFTMHVNRLSLSKLLLSYFSITYFEHTKTWLMKANECDDYDPTLHYIYDEEINPQYTILRPSVWVNSVGTKSKSKVQSKDKKIPHERKFMISALLGVAFVMPPTTLFMHFASKASNGTSTVNKKVIGYFLALIKSCNDLTGTEFPLEGAISRDELLRNTANAANILQSAIRSVKTKYSNRVFSNANSRQRITDVIQFDDYETEEIDLHDIDVVEEEEEEEEEEQKGENNNNNENEDES